MSNSIVFSLAHLTQRGVIVFGAGLNVRHWIDTARKAGYLVLICDGHARLYR